MSIQESDYIFSIRGDGSTQQNLASLVATLQDSGFRIQARPGVGASVLVFARISAQTYSELLHLDLQKSLDFGATGNGDSPADRARIVYAYLTSPSGSAEFKGVGLTPGKDKWAFIESVLPNTAYLKDRGVQKAGLKSLLAASLSTSAFTANYGTNVALYFEFLKFYILGLGILSIFGTIAHLKSKTYSLTYSFVSLAWGVLFLLLWKHRERYLAHLWGVSNASQIAKYDADLTKRVPDAKSHRNGSRAASRFMRELAFVPIALVFVAVLVSYQLGCFMLEIFLSEIYDGPLKVVFTLIPTVLITVFVPILTIVYNLIVDKFLSWEGHDNKYTRYDSFVVKTFTLNFLTGYMPLLITSFIYLPFAHFIAPELPVIKTLVISNIHQDRYAYKLLSQIKSQREFTINQSRLDKQFFFFMVTNQIILLILKYGLPLVVPRVIKLVTTKILGKKEGKIPEDDAKEKQWLSEVRRYIQLPEYNIHDDYRSLCLQFGYLAMFGPVWTLAPLLSMVFNVITFKLDTWKLTSGKYFRPPVPKRADSIHPWDVAFFLLAWLGSLISPAVAVFYRHGTAPPKSLGKFALDKASVNVSSSTYLWLTLLASEHFFFLLFFVGSKVTSFLRSDSEIENNVAQRTVRFEKSAKSPSLADKDADWKEISVEQIKSQAAGSVESSVVSSEKGVLTAVASSSTKSSENDQKLSNRSSTLEQLESKKAQLERVKHTLEKKQLEAQKETGDRIIDTIDSEGKKTQAIIDGDLHISMKDVDDIEKKLTEKEQQLKKAKTTDAEMESVQHKSEGLSQRTSLDEKADSNKTSRKKTLKKLLKKRA